MRNVITIDVSKMSEKEICKLLGIEYIPWYKSTFFWSLVLLFSYPAIAILMVN